MIEWGMALSDFLNKDPFAAGGVMDAPDLQMRQIYNKIALGGLAGQLSAQEQRRLAVRQGLEQQSMQTAAQKSPNLQAVLGQAQSPDQLMQGLQGLKPMQPAKAGFQTALEGLMGGPASRQMAQQQQQFETTQQRMATSEATKQRMGTAASMIALGQDISGLKLSPSELYQAITEGALLKEKGQSKLRTDEGGVPTETTYDILGRPIAKSRIQSPIMTPEQAAAIEAAKVRAEASAKRLEGLIGGAYEGVQKNTMVLEETARARSMIQQGAGMGPGAEAKLALKKAANIVAPGLFDTSKEEIAKGTFASMALTASNRLKGQGQVTEAERKLVADTVPSFKSDKDAALYMMDFIDAAAKREIAKADFIDEQRSKGVELTESSLTRKFYQDNPLSKFGFEPSGKGAAPAAAGPATPAAQPAQSQPALVKQNGITYRLVNGQYVQVK